VDAAQVEAPLPAFEAEAPAASAEPAFEEKAFELRSEAHIGFEARAFLPDEDSRTHDQTLALAAELDLTAKHGSWDEKLRVFGRVDALDAPRATLFLEEGYVQFRAGPHRILLGAEVERWTVLEVFKPFDTLNARDLDDNILDPRKLGEPTLASTFALGPQTTLSLYELPFVVFSHFTSPEERLHFAPTGIDPGRVDIVADVNGGAAQGPVHAQGAIRLLQSFDSLDLSLTLLHHVDRAFPYVVADPVTLAPAFLHQTATEAGAAATLAAGSFLFKAEGGYRYFWPIDPHAPIFFRPTSEALGPVRDLLGDRVGAAFESLLRSENETLTQGEAELVPNRSHGVLAAGLEYGTDHAGGQSSSVFVEGTTLLDIGSELARDLTPFQRDVSLGYRLSFNDVAGRRVILGVVADAETWDEAVAYASYTQTLDDVWTLSGGLWAFFTPPPERASVLGFVRNADHLYLSLTRHF
jgi:hypothetical protein